MTEPGTARRLILLGSTGSIGTSTLEVVDHLHRHGLARFEIVGLAGGRRARELGEQARRWRVGHVAIADGHEPGALDGVAHVYTGPDAARQLVEAVARPGDLVLGAMVGAAGLPASMAAIARGCDLALANKETLVAAGELVLPLARKAGVHLLPVDSEHSAIFQCLAGGRGLHEVERLVLTASGGPFRTWTPERLAAATVEDALAHPTWSMGPKVTIDSASLMNKALEVIEAHWLFDMPASKVHVVIHPQSVIHSFVEFVDGSVMAQLSPPDMKSPIQYALTWPQRVAGSARRLDWSQAARLDLETVDHQRFPALRLAYRAIEQGGTAGAIFNASNEAAVAAFMQRRILFGRIPRLVEQAMDAVPVTPVRGLDDVRHADGLARREVQGLLDADRTVGTTGASVPKPPPRRRHSAVTD